MTDHEVQYHPDYELDMREVHMLGSATWNVTLARFKRELVDLFYDKLPDSFEGKIWVDKARIKTSHSTWKKLVVKLGEKPELEAPTTAEALNEIVQDIVAVRVLSNTLTLQRRAQKLILGLAAENNYGVADIDDYVTHPKASGYRAVHITLALPAPEVTIDPEKEHFARPQDFIAPRRVLVEIQLHTMLQHAWCEITHEEGYKTAHEVDASLHQTSSQVAHLLHQADLLAAHLYVPDTGILPIISRHDPEPPSQGLANYS